MGPKLFLGRGLRIVGMGLAQCLIESRFVGPNLCLSWQLVWPFWCSESPKGVVGPCRQNLEPVASFLPDLRPPLSLTAGRRSSSRQKPGLALPPSLALSLPLSSRGPPIAPVPSLPAPPWSEPADP